MFGLFEGPPSKRAKIDQVFEPCKANEVLQLHLLDTATATSVVHSFPPLFTHQLYGDEEEIAGYDGLHVTLSLCPRTFCALLDLRFAKKRVGADDVVGPLKTAFAGDPQGDPLAGLAETREDFERARQQQLQGGGPHWDSLGEPLGGCGEGEARINVYSVKLSQAHASIQALHARLQPLLLLFVDGGSAIEADDPQWDLLLATATTGGVRHVVGYCTVYNFCVFPKREKGKEPTIETRMRVSQVLVLPPYQGRGVGGALLGAVYALADKRRALDVTYEEATADLQRLRLRAELGRATSLRWLCQLAAESSAAALAAVQRGAPAHAAVTVVASQANGTAAAKGKSPGKGRDEERSRPGKGEGKALPASGTSPSSHADALADLRLEPAEAARICRDLRIGRKAAPRLWELMLWRQSPMRGPVGRALMEALVRDRLAAASAQRGPSPATKRVFSAPLEGSNFIMMRATPGQKGLGEAPEAEREGVEALSPEEQEAALATATAEGLALLGQVTGLASS